MFLVLGIGRIPAPVLAARLSFQLGWAFSVRSFFVCRGPVLPCLDSARLLSVLWL